MLPDSPGKQGQPLQKLGSERGMLRKPLEKERSPAASAAEEDEEKENERGQNFIQVPAAARNPPRSPGAFSENFLLPQSPNDLITGSLGNGVGARDEKLEKKLSFSLGGMMLSKALSRKDIKESKELNAFRFVNSVKRTTALKHANPKIFKSSRNLLAAEGEGKTSEGHNATGFKSSRSLLMAENELKSNDNHNKMDKSSLFFRNQLIAMNKMKGMDPVEQMFWAIKHNNIHKVAGRLILYLFLRRSRSCS